MTPQPPSEGLMRSSSGGEPARVTQPQLLAGGAAIQARSDRFPLGLTGPPGSGKSTLAALLAKSLHPTPPVVPMDGFHLPHAVIEARGLADRKGCPESFDPWGFVQLLTQLASPTILGVVHAPSFDRRIEEPITGAIRIKGNDRLVVAEGNYLLLDDPGWSQIRRLLDLCAFLEVDDETRIGRLISRHMRYGRTRVEAERFVLNSDERNAELIQTTRNRADLIVCMDP